MEKNSYNYPQMPPQMTSAGADQMPPAPPSYDQATGSATPAAVYPPVQVLPSTQAANNGANSVQQQQRNQPHQQQPQPMPQPTYPTHRHNPPTVSITTGQPGFHATPHNMPPHMMQQPVVIIQQQAILPLGPEPSYITCPACHIQKLTRIEYEPSSRTHLMAALLCILGFWCCVCLPYCAGSCMNTNHYCGNCNKFLGTYGNGL